MAWLNFEGSGKVHNKSFTSPHDPNLTWFMNATSPYEISQTNYLNFDAYITIKHDPWEKNNILILDV
jgi:hypothetical protein